MTRYTSAPELAMKVAALFDKMDSGGCAKLLLDSDVELTIVQAGRSDEILCLPAQLDVHFPHNLGGSNGIATNVPKQNRSKTWFTLTSEDGAVFAVKGITEKGDLRVIRAIAGTSRTRRSTRPFVSELQMATA